MSDDLMYQSANGDAWYLRTEPKSTRLSVVHRPNGASKGAETVTSIDKFVERDDGSPEVQAARAAMEEMRG